jgi:hypothetical protein
MAIIQDIMNFVPSWQKHLDESGYLKADPSGDYHQKAGYNFYENFPNTPPALADALAKGYQYSTEGIGALFSGNPSGEIVDYLDSTTKDPAWAKRAKEEARLNSLGFRGKGFNMDEYDQTMNFARTGDTSGLTYGSAQAKTPAVKFNEWRRNNINLAKRQSTAEKFANLHNSSIQSQKYQDEDLEGYSDWGYRDEEIGKGSKFYDPTHSRIQSILNPIKKKWSKYGKPIMGSIMGGIMNIPGVGLLMNSVREDPYAANRIGMYGAYKDPSTGFMKDKFGYNVGTTLMKNRFLEPGSNSYRSYALDSLNKLAGRKWDHKRYMETGKGYGPASQKQKQLNDYYQETYNKSFDDIKKSHQKKKPAFGDTTLGGYEGSDAGFAASEPSTASSTDWGSESAMIARGGLAQRAPRGSYLNGGLASLWRR